MLLISCISYRKEKKKKKEKYKKRKKDLNHSKRDMRETELKLGTSFDRRVFEKRRKKGEICKRKGCWIKHRTFPCNACRSFPRPFFSVSLPLLVFPPSYILSSSVISLFFLYLLFYGPSFFFFLIEPVINRFSYIQLVQ